MPVELKEKYPFSVDTWSLISKKKKYHFLTHAHSDHTSGIESFARRRIHCTEITRRLVLRRFPKLQSTAFATLEIGDTRLIFDDEDSFTVTALDANHCSGAVMFLFEGDFGNILHTGDCRLTDECLRDILGKYKTQQCLLDCVYLDCTFGKEFIRLPSKQEAFYQVQQCILNHPKAPIIYLACDLLGHEELLSDLVMYFRSRIYVDKDSLPEYNDDMKLVIPDLLTDDSSSTKFHVCEGFPKLYERAKLKFMEAHRLDQELPLFIRPSAQWYTYEERLEGAGYGIILGISLKRPSGRRHRMLPTPRVAEKDQYGIWHVCYSAHSSRSELERAMDVLWPKEVISTTPHCHAKEVVSGRVGMFHVDMPKPQTKAKVPGSCENILHAGQKTKSSSEIGRGKILRMSQVEERFLESLERRNMGETLLENVVPLFGPARHNIPPSPPMSFSSESQGSFDSEATELYVSSDVESDAAPISTDFTFNTSTLCKEVCHRDQKSISIGTGRSSEDSKFLSLQGGSCWPVHVASDPGLTEEELNRICSVGATLTLDPPKKRTADDAGLQDGTRKLYRSFRVPIPCPLPSLLDLYSFNN